MTPIFPGYTDETELPAFLNKAHDTKNQMSLTSRGCF